MTATQHDAGTTSRKTADAGPTPGFKAPGATSTRVPKVDVPTPTPTPAASGPGFEIPSFDIPTVEATTERIRDLNERIIESSKSAGLVTLDTYEKALQSLVDFETKVASSTQLEWVSAVATTHAKFISDLTASYTKATRDLLS